MNKPKTGCLYWDKCHPGFLYLMVDDNLNAFEFGPIDASSYRYLEYVKVTSESLTEVEVDEGLRLSWWPFGGAGEFLTWKLCITLSDQLPSRNLEFLDMDAVFEYVRAQQENSDSPLRWCNFDFLGSFYFEDGKVHYTSDNADRTIFEKILK